MVLPTTACNKNSTRRYKHRSSSSDDATITPKMLSQSHIPSATSDNEPVQDFSQPAVRSEESTNETADEPVNQTEELVREAPRCARDWPLRSTNVGESEDSSELLEQTVVDVNELKEAELPTHVWYAQHTRAYFLGGLRSNRLSGQPDVSRIHYCICDLERGNDMHGTECVYRQSDQEPTLSRQSALCNERSILQPVLMVTLSVTLLVIIAFYYTMKSKTKTKP